MDRRTLLTSIGALAGGEGLVPDTPRREVPDETGQTSVESPPGVTIAETGTECSKSSAEITARATGSTVTVSGRVIAQTPCHELDITTSDGCSEFTVNIETYEPPESMCVQCMAQISFDGEIDAPDYEVITVNIGGEEPRSRTVDLAGVSVGDEEESGGVDEDIPEVDEPSQKNELPVTDGLFDDDFDIFWP